MTTTIATAGVAAYGAADWSESLEASANTAYVTNPRMLAGSNTADRYGALTVDGSITAQTERVQLSVTPRFAATRYQDDSTLNTDTGVIDVNSLWKLERGQWGLNAQGLVDSTLTSELGLTGITTINRKHEYGSFSGNYQFFATERLSWLMQGTWAIVRYSDAGRFGLRSYDYASVQLGPTWNFSERLQGSLLLGADRIMPQGDNFQYDTSASLQLKRVINERSSWHVSVGETRVDLGMSVGTSSLFELGATRQSERVQWDISLLRNVTPIGLGLLARKDQAALTVTGATSEHCTLRLSLSVIRSAPVTFYQFRLYNGAVWGQLNAEWRWQISPRWASTIAYSRGRSRIDNGGLWADGNQARINLAWQSGRL